MTTFFFFDFHRLISEININHRLISITTDTSGMLSSPLGNRIKRPNCPSAQLPLAGITRSDDKVFQDFVVGIFKEHLNSHHRGGAFATQRRRDWYYACEFSTWDLKLEELCLAVCYLSFKTLIPVFASLEFQKQGYTFVIRLYLGTETVSWWQGWTCIETWQSWANIFKF